MTHESNMAPRKLTVVLAFALFLFAAGTYLPTLHYEFLNWDDEVYLVDNHYLKPPRLSSLPGTFGSTYFSNYHPLTIISYMADTHMWGMRPAGYRLTNIVLHAATCVLAMLLARALGAGPWAAFLGILIFAVHPLRVEAVVWLSQRKEVLCGLFYIGGLLAWVRATSQTRGKAGALLALSSFLCLLALFSKPMAVSFPAVVLAHDAVLARGRMRKRVPLYLALLAMAGAFATATFLSQQVAILDLRLVTRLKLVTWGTWHYTRTTLLPVDISPIYPLASCPAFQTWPAIWGGVFFAFGVGLTLWWVRRSPVMGFGLLAGGIILAPVSGIVPIGYPFAADRYSYLASIPIFAAGAAALSGWLNRREKQDRLPQALVLGAALIVLTLAALTIFDTAPAWKDRRAFWSRIHTLYPKDDMARRNLAVEVGQLAGRLQADGRRGEARGLAKEALKLHADVLDAVRVLVEHEMRNERWEAVAAMTEEMESRKGIKDMVRCYLLTRRGMALRKLGRHDEAEQAIDRAFKLSRWPYPSVGTNLFFARLALDAERPALAVELLEGTLRMAPTSVPVMRQLAHMKLRATNDRAGAEVLLRRALELEPDNAALKEDLGRVLENAPPAPTGEPFPADPADAEEIPPGT